MDATFSNVQCAHDKCLLNPTQVGIGACIFGLYFLTLWGQLV